ncbi:MAG TPA: glycosyltransferase [Coleofasciculaceae cyanobacterium]
MRIAIISTVKSWGGSEELWTEMADVALKEGHEIILSLFQPACTRPKVTQLQQQGARILPRPLGRPGKIGVLTYKYIFSFRKLFQTKPDVIFINLGGTYDPSRVNLSDLFKLLYKSAIPYVVICHCSEEIHVLNQPNVRDQAIDFFKRAASVLFVSQHNLKSAERQLAMTLPGTRIVRNPVNLTNLDLVPWTSSDTVRFANVARLQVDSKGQDILLEALSLPVWQDRDWQLGLYGEGNDRLYLEKLARHYGIADRVKFYGHVKDIRQVWSENDILVLPSRKEGTPLSLVEAMLCGRPMVVTDVGGNTEWVEEAKTGFVAEAPTAYSISAALERAYRAKPNWETMGLLAHDTAFRKFDHDPGRSLLKLILQAADQQAEQGAKALSPLHC